MDCLCFVLLCFVLKCLFRVSEWCPAAQTGLLGVTVVSDHIIKDIYFVGGVGYRPEIPSHDLVSGYLFCGLS